MSHPFPFAKSDTVTALAEELASGGVSSRRLTERALANAEARRSEGGHSLTRIWRDEALAAAEQEDRLRARGLKPSSAISGIPIVIKDNCDVRGDVTQAGSASREHSAAALTDAECIARLRLAGAILVGKSNMTEFACANTGANSAFGTPANPCDPSRIVGGSSSGSAAAVAEGSVVAALGSDTGGSVRGPAALCGLAGFKPSEGRIPTRGVLPLSTTLDTLGPIARTIECCAVMDAVLSAEDWRPLPEVSLQVLTFGVPVDLVLDGLDAAVAAAFDHVLRNLRESGATIREFAWPELRSRDWRKSYSVFCRGEMYAAYGRFAEANARLMESKPFEIIMGGKAVTMQDKAEAEAFRSRKTFEAHDLLSPFHAVLLPTVPVVAPLISSLDDANASEVENLLGRNNEPANFFNCCAATVPCQKSGDLPVGLMLMAPAGGDRRVLSIAKAVENRLAQARLG